MIVQSRLRQLCQLDNSWFTNARLRAEPNLFLCSYDFTRRVGGEAINHILDSFGDTLDVDRTLIVARTVYIQEGLYAWNPGWHCDGLREGDRFDSPSSTETHYVCTVGSAEAPTEFIHDDVELDCDWFFEGHESYHELDGWLRDRPNYNIVRAPSGAICELKGADIHRVTPCTKMGYRMFVIVITNTDAAPVNEIPTTSQVYVPVQLNNNSD